MKYRPEEWDEPSPELLKHLDEFGLRPAFDLIVEKVETYWRMWDEYELGKLDSEMLEDSVTYHIAFSQVQQARGAYEALQLLLDKEHRKLLIEFCKYSVLY